MILGRRKNLWKLVLRTLEFDSFKDCDPTLAKVSPTKPSMLKLEVRQTRDSENRFRCPRDFRHFWGQYGLSDDCLLSSNVERCVARQFSVLNKNYHRSEISPSNGQLLVELRHVLYKVGLGSKFFFGFTCLSCDLELVRQRKWPYINNSVKFSFHWILQEKPLAINKSSAYSR